jgi:hypothetical protein
MVTLGTTNYYQKTNGKDNKKSLAPNLTCEAWEAIDQ